MNSVTRCTGLITAALLLGIPTGSRAQEAAVQQDRKWQVDLDLAGVLMHSSATVDVAGMRIPGASANVSNAVTGAFGLSYSLTPSIAIELEAGIPARATITGAGSIAPFGTIATTRYGAGILSVQYRFVGLGHFEPYAAIGVGYAIFFGTSGTAVSNVKLTNSWAASFDGGIRYYLNSAWALRFHVRQLLVGTRISGQLGPAPLSAKATLNPTIIGAGLSFRF